MYRNVMIGEWCYLTVKVAGRTYILGRTGHKDWCQDLGRMM